MPRPAPRRRRRPVRTSWLVEHLGLSRSDYPPERRGFIAVQIDGLGYYVLKGALNRRYTPFLRKLVKRRGWRLHRFHVGLPATTPASQLGVMYGNNHDVPGFRWVEKDKRQLHITKSAAVCAAVEKRIAAGSPGILRGGASYCNMFSGDAAASTLTLATLGRTHQGRLSTTDLAIFLLLSIGLLVRIVALSLWEALVELYDHLLAMQTGRPARDEGAFPIIRVVTNVVFREIATQGTLLDILRGVPFVYLNYSGYDEVAHHRGPNTVYAKLVLRGIDRQVRRIVAAVERFGAREYDVILLSDHGQSTTIPWEHLYGESLTDFILRHTAAPRLRALGADHRAKQVARAMSMANWLREVEWMLPRGAGRVVRAASSWMAERLPDEVSDVDWDEQANVLVAPTGSLAHVYFTDVERPLTLAEVRTRHPQLMLALLAHPSVAVLAARSGDGGLEVVSSRGALRVGASGVQALTGEHPLDAFIDGRELLGEVQRLVAMPHAGDLVLFSAKHAGRVVNFQVEMGSHGGLHLDEQAAFVLAPPEVQFDFAAVRSIRDLYRLFRGYHAEAAEAATPSVSG
jgi:hypothetical protein